MDKKYGPREMFPANDELTRISNYLCSDENAVRGVCVKIYLAAFGFDPWNVNRTLIPDIMNNIPAGVSSRQLIHYSQAIRSGITITNTFNTDILNYVINRKIC